MDVGHALKKCNQMCTGVDTNAGFNWIRFSEIVLQLCFLWDFRDFESISEALCVTPLANDGRHPLFRCRIVIFVTACFFKTISARRLYVHAWL